MRERIYNILDELRLNSTRKYIKEHNKGSESVLDLTDCNIDDSQVSGIIKFLLKYKCFTEVYFTRNNITGAGAGLISAMLEKDNTIRIFSLSYNNIGKEGAFAIAGMLEKNETLKVICLHQSGIDEEGGAAINRAMIKNKTVTDIHMHMNGIAPDALRSINKNAMDNIFLPQTVEILFQVFKYTLPVFSLSGRYDDLYLPKDMIYFEILTKVFNLTLKSRLQDNSPEFGNKVIGSFTKAVISQKKSENKTLEDVLENINKPNRGRSKSENAKSAFY